MQFKCQLLSATSAAALMLFSQTAHATTVVGYIIGAYDSNTGAGYENGVTNGTGITLSNFASNGGGTSDTPSLYILNTSGSAWTGLTITLTGYQDAANGGTGATFQNPGPGPAITQTLTLPTIGASTVYQLVWNGSSITGGSVGAPSASPTGLNLFASDYDDALGGRVSAGTVDSAGHVCNSGSGTANSLCSYVGNFDVSFSALLGGNPIAANFSPSNTQGGGNVAGTFVGWEGLDVDGFSETSADQHSLSTPGVLAIITTGTAGLQTSSVPEPGTLTLFGAGLGALGLLRRRRKRSEPNG